MKGLSIRKLADRSEPRVRAFDPLTGERVLINPETGLAEPWPLVGIAIEGEVPDVCKVPTTTVRDGVAGGYMELDNPSVVHRPGGPDEEPWRVTHSFVHADAVTLKCVDRAYRYRVTHQPDKYDDETEPSGKRVDWFYVLELELED